MKRRSPEQAGYAAIAELDPLGRASCFALSVAAERAPAVLLRLPPGDRASAALAWGKACGVGALRASGADEAGPWFVRQRQGTPLDRYLSHGPDLRAALVVFVRLARLLARCEGKRIFPGPLWPDTIDVQAGDLDVELAGDAWLRDALGGAPAELGLDERRLRFYPPEQLAGAPFDAAANRYLFGLLLYECLAGEAPFAGPGLRFTLDERTERAPAAFSAERAAPLPEGLQGLCLRLLDPDPRRRPDSAQRVVRELARILNGRATRRAAPAAPRVRPGKALVRPRASLEVARRWPAVAAGVVLAVSVLLAVGGRSPARPRAEIGDRPALGSAATALACESCHPRHTAEWRRSVMAHSATSPLFQALEQLITEQVGRSADCPEGAGVLRPAGAGACRDSRSGVAVTGSGGPGWCSNCHLPLLQTLGEPPAFDALASDGQSRRPLAELVPAAALEGIACSFCHQATGPVGREDTRRGEYVGNASWTSPVSGRRFDFRPEAARGLAGIANSGARVAPLDFLPGYGGEVIDLVPSGAHRRTSESARRYLRSSEFCGSCHDVRLFGTDVLGAAQGEHFKRLRNAYSEWRDWREARVRTGRDAATCVDCHLSTFPGVCVPETEAPARPSAAGCPPGTRFEPRPPGSLSEGRAASNSAAPSLLHPHYFTGVDHPLDPRFAERAEDDELLDPAGLPLGSGARRDLLLAHALRLDVSSVRRTGGLLRVPVRIENVGAGHRVPAGFSQERELWVHLTVRDARGRILYEVGRVDGPSEDLADKVFLRVNVSDRSLDGEGRPIGLFGADVRDGPDAPRWSPPPELGGERFFGRGLINFQNGFLRCVRCIGRIAPDGSCQALPGQERTRADRFDDGDYDSETGACVSNLRGRDALFETYFPVGALDASRGVLKAPDAIIDTRSLPPERPVEYVYELDLGRAPGPVTVEARLLFRAFPPFLLRAFIDYEREQAARGKRPRGPLIDERALRRLGIVEVARTHATEGPA